MSRERLREYASRRTKTWLPREKWGPKCAGCGMSDEFRIDGYCSIECRDYYCEDSEEMRDVLDLLDVIEALESAVRIYQREFVDIGETKATPRQDPGRNSRVGG